MKRILAVLLAVAMSAIVFAGCASKEEAPVEDVAQETELAEAGLKTGLAVVANTGASKEAGEKDGVAKANASVAAVTVDANGVITDCVIDVVGSEVAFSTEGKLVTPVETTFPTKLELGEEYGMKKVSQIGKEWNEQADAFCQYVIGKTMDEVNGIALNEGGVATDEELASSVTISVSNYIDLVAKAVENAQVTGAEDGDKLSLGITTNMSNSKDAGEKDGVAQAYSTYAAVTFAKDGTITSCIIDSSQATVNFSAEGKITSDIDSEIKTKNELGEDYGMKAISTIGKEWNEQAAAFAEYAVGKNVEDISGIAVTETGSPSDEELAASVTMGVGSFTEVIEKAQANVVK